MDNVFVCFSEDGGLGLNTAIRQRQQWLGEKNYEGKRRAKERREDDVNTEFITTSSNSGHYHL